MQRPLQGGEGYATVMASMFIDQVFTVLKAYAPRNDLRLAITTIRNLKNTPAHSVAHAADPEGRSDFTGIVRARPLMVAEEKVSLPCWLEAGRTAGNSAQRRTDASAQRLI